MGTKVSSSLVLIYSSEIAGLCVRNMFNFIKNCHFFPKVAVPFSFLPAISENSNYPASLKALNFCLFFFQIELVFIIENKINMFFSPVLLKYNRHTAQCKFKVYGIKI